MIHLLTETDSFSDVHGAALQRWVANVLRFENDPSVVACARADITWGLDHVRTLLLPEMYAYSKIRGRYRLPWKMRRPILRRILRPAVNALEPGSVVWIHNRPDYVAAIEADIRARGGKIVLHLHNPSPVSSPRGALTSCQPDRIVCCHPELTQTAVIYNGADERRFFPAMPKPKSSGESRTQLVLFAGRLVPEKGAHIFVEAMWLLLARDARVRGLVLGATGFGSASKPTSYSRSLLRDAPRNVEFGGYRAAAELAEEFRRADIFCSPSVWDEPFGLVNVEAMASRLPVISTRGGGVPEIFAEGGGVLVERDSPAELAAAIEGLISNEPRRHELAAEGYASFHRNFTWHSVHRRYCEVLSELGGDGQAANGATVAIAETPEEEALCQHSR